MLQLGLWGFEWIGRGVWFNWGQYKNNKMFVDLKEANRPSDAMSEIWLELFSC